MAADAAGRDGRELDIAAADLRRELGKPLAHIDRGYPGFGDFANAATRAIEPGSPDRSLLYHAFASPTVAADRNGVDLHGFPTLAEIDAVENYVYGVEPPTLEALQARVDAAPSVERRKLGLVVYALQYRNAPVSVHGRHAELCFARSGISRLGTLEPFYDARARNFVALDPARPFDFRVEPRRFAAYLAAQFAGRGKFGPQDPLPGDDELQFWAPVHKLFSGPECIAGLNLQVGLSEASATTSWRSSTASSTTRTGEQLVRRRARRVSVHDQGRIHRVDVERPDFGEGVLVPRPSPLVTPAQYKGRLDLPGRRKLHIQAMEYAALVDADFADEAARPEKSPIHAGRRTETQRPAPEYTNIRHRLLPNGEIDDLNLRPDMKRS